MTDKDARDAAAMALLGGEEEIPLDIPDAEGDTVLESLGMRYIQMWAVPEKNELWHRHPLCDGRADGVRWIAPLDDIDLKTWEGKDDECANCAQVLPVRILEAPPGAPTKDQSPTTRSYAALAEKIGIDTSTSTVPEGKPWMLHEEFLEKDEQACAVLSARGRQRRSYRMDMGGGTCEGMLVIEDDQLEGGNGTLVAECNRCGFRIGLKREAFDPHYVLRRNLARSGIPERYIGKRMGQVEGQSEAKNFMRQYIEEWMQPYVSGDEDATEGPPLRLPAPLLWGEAGRGKSHLICSVAETLIRKHGADVLYVPLAALLDKIRASFDDTAPDELRKAAGQMWERACQCELLILDDLGAERPTEWAQEKLQLLVDTRYMSERPILIGSNIPPSLWESFFGKRTASRLTGMTLPVQVGGPDLREQEFVDPSTGEIVS